MTEKLAAKTRISNTGSDSQTGFSVGIDWIAYTHNQLRTGLEVTEILSALESIAGDQIDFSTNRPRFDNHKHWLGSGRSQKGLLLWYNPPRSSDDLLIKSLDGNLISHPGLLPAGHHPVPDFAADYIREQLPDYAELHHDSTPVCCYDPNDGSEYTHHGYSIVPAGDGAIERPGELRVSMSARYLDNVDMSQLAAWLNIIAPVYGLRCSRLDVALDDHEKQIPLSVVEQARCDRNFFNVRSTSVVKSDDVSSNEKGQTIYFGSRQSEAFMRVYDKTVESKGERLGNRWESEFKGAKADEICRQWLAAMDTDESRASRLLVDVVLGTVDFRDRSKGKKNRDRCPLLSWFAEMCEMLAAVPVRLRVPRPKQTMQRTVDYLKRSVAPSIASLSKALGSQFSGFLRDLIKDGDARMTNVRRKITEDCDISELCY